MQATQIEQQARARMTFYVALLLFVVCLPFVTRLALQGEPTRLMYLVVSQAIVSAGYYLAWRHDRPSSFTLAWITLCVVMAGIVRLHLGDDAPGAFGVLVLMPLLATLVHSPRAGWITAAGCWAAFLAPIAFPLSGAAPRYDYLLLGGGVSTALCAIGMFLESSRSRTLVQLRDLSNRLEHSEARFRSYAENSHDVVAEFDPEGRLLYMSPGHEGLLGRPRSDFAREQAYHETVHPDDAPDLEFFFASVLRGDRDGECAIRYIRSDGGLRWLRLRGCAYRNAFGEQRVVLYSHDETEKREADLQREELLIELQSSLDNVKTLRGIVPICAVCKKIRAQDGRWEPLEVHIASQTHADFSHGLCDECLEDAAD